MIKNLLKIKCYLLGHQYKITDRINGHDWDIVNISKKYVLYTTKDEYGASGIPYWFAKLLIYKGCLKYLLGFKSNV